MHFHLQFCTISNPLSRFVWTVRTFFQVCFKNLNKIIQRFWVIFKVFTFYVCSSSTWPLPRWTIWVTDKSNSGSGLFCVMFDTSQARGHKISIEILTWLMCWYALGSLTSCSVEEGISRVSIKRASHDHDLIGKVAKKNLQKKHRIHFRFFFPSRPLYFWELVLKIG